MAWLIIGLGLLAATTLTGCGDYFGTWLSFASSLST
jgi:hypothetical protein